MATSESAVDMDLMVRAAWLYYEDGLTQAQVARRLFVSRQTVGRLLEAARKSGVVRVSIDSRWLAAFSLSDRLRQRYGLKDAVIVPEAGGFVPGTVNERVASAVASYLMRYLHPGAVVGLAWGDTAARALGLLPEEALEGVEIASAAGSIRALVDSLASKASVVSRLRLVPAPLIASTPAIAAAMLDERTVKEVLELASTATVVITGIGSADPNTASAVRSGVISNEELARFIEAGAVGDILGEWFAKDGSIVESATSSRRIGIPLSRLKEMDNVVGVAGGLEKVTAIRGAIAGGYINALITDEQTARALLEPQRRTR